MVKDGKNCFPPTAPSFSTNAGSHSIDSWYIFFKQMKTAFSFYADMTVAWWCPILYSSVSLIHFCVHKLSGFGTGQRWKCCFPFFKPLNGKGWKMLRCMYLETFSKLYTLYTFFLTRSFWLKTEAAVCPIPCSRQFFPWLDCPTERTRSSHFTRMPVFLPLKWG